jgi:hypothetical protein
MPLWTVEWPPAAEGGGVTGAAAPPPPKSFIFRRRRSHNINSRHGCIVMLSLCESVHSQYQAKNRQVVGRRDDSVLSASDSRVTAWRGEPLGDCTFDSPALSGTLNSTTPLKLHTLNARFLSFLCLFSVFSLSFLCLFSGLFSVFGVSVHHE